MLLQLVDSFKTLVTFEIYVSSAFNVFRNLMMQVLKIVKKISIEKSPLRPDMDVILFPVTLRILYLGHRFTNLT